MAKLGLNSYSKNAMATAFANKVVGGAGYNQVIGLFRTDITASNGVEFNNIQQISLVDPFVNDNLTIKGLQNFKALQLNNTGGKVTLSSVHDISSTDDIGNYENIGSLVWAIPGGRNVHQVVIGSLDASTGYLRPHAAIQLSSAIPPTSDAKTFLISNLSIEFKGDSE